MRTHNSCIKNQFSTTLWLYILQQIIWHCCIKYLLRCFFPIQFETIWTNKELLTRFENIVIFLWHIKTIIIFTLSKIRNNRKFITRAEAVARMCSVKKVFLEVLQNTCARVPFCQRTRLWHRSFPVNFAKFLRIPFFIEHLWWLFLYFHVAM